MWIFIGSIIGFLVGWNTAATTSDWTRTIGVFVYHSFIIGFVAALFRRAISFTEDYDGTSGLISGLSYGMFNVLIMEYQKDSTSIILIGIMGGIGFLCGWLVDKLTN